MTDEMSHKEFIVANFFTPENELPPPTVKRLRKRRDPEIAALAKFARAVEQMTQSSRRAHIGWLAHKYLGIRLP